MVNEECIFRCETDETDKIFLDASTSKSLILGWSVTDCSCVRLSRESCGRLVKQIHHFLDNGCLLPEEPSEPTSNAKAMAKTLLAVVGLEVELDELRVIQDANDGDEH